MIKVCHVTSVHPRNDIRIFRKECVSLARAGYEVTLVQQGESGEQDGVHLLGFGAVETSRLKRMTQGAKKAYMLAKTVDADIYHLHDPELLPYGVKLKRAGKKVIFDSHEDVPADILEKYWLPKPLRKMISRMYAFYETKKFAKLDGLIGVTPSLCDRLKKSNKGTAMITNYPIWEDGLPEPTFTENKVVFPGLLSDLWSIGTLLEVAERLPGLTVELRSSNVEGDLLARLQAMPGWKQVNFPGRATHDEVMRLMTECLCGMALCLPCPNTGGNLGTLGNTKIFEYMMAGIPVVCTNFVLWKEIVERWECGICVDPTDVDAVTNAVRFFMEHPDRAREMGANGRRAVRETYNWEQQEKVLLDFYKTVG